MFQNNGRVHVYEWKDSKHVILCCFAKFFFLKFRLFVWRKRQVLCNVYDTFDDNDTNDRQIQPDNSLEHLAQTN